MPLCRILDGGGAQGKGALDVRDEASQGVDRQRSSIVSGNE